MADSDWQPGDPVYALEATFYGSCGPCLVRWTAPVDVCPECGQASTETLRAALAAPVRAQSADTTEPRVCSKCGTAGCLEDAESGWYDDVPTLASPGEAKSGHVIASAMAWTCSRCGEAWDSRANFCTATPDCAGTPTGIGTQVVRVASPGEDTAAEQAGDEVADLRAVLAQRERELKAALTELHTLRTAPDGLSTEREQRFEHLATLDSNWDSYDAQPPSAAALVKAREIAVWLTGEPLICPTADGGVQLAWPRYEERFEIVVAESGAVGMNLDDVEFAPVPAARTPQPDDVAVNIVGGAHTQPGDTELDDAIEQIVGDYIPDSLLRVDLAKRVLAEVVKRTGLHPFARPHASEAEGEPA